jgi:hypothetical protein
MPYNQLFIHLACSVCTEKCRTLNFFGGPLPSFVLFANLCTAVALSYYGLMYMQHAIYHFKAYNIIYTNIITDDLQGKNLNV